MKNHIFSLTLALLSASVFGQRANFSGDWKLDEGKSKLGFEYSIAPGTLKVVHRRKTLDLTSVSEWDGRETETRQHFTLDGEACENTGPMEHVTTSTAVYNKQEKNLKIVTAGSLEGMDYTLTQVLSMKGDELVVESEASSDMGSICETFVFDRQ